MHKMHNKQVFIVRAGDSFRDWGVVQRSSRGLACRTCARNKRKCAHKAPVPGVSECKLCTYNRCSRV